MSVRTAGGVHSDCFSPVETFQMATARGLVRSSAIIRIAAKNFPSGETESDDQETGWFNLGSFRISFPLAASRNTITLSAPEAITCFPLGVNSTASGSSRKSLFCAMSLPVRVS